MGRREFFSHLLWARHIQMIYLWLHSSISNRVKNTGHILHFPFKQEDNLNYRNPQACIMDMWPGEEDKIGTRLLLECEMNLGEQV